MRRFSVLFAALFALVAPAVLAAEALRLNEIQVLGSHNSYKLMMRADTFADLERRAPDTAAALEYWHLPLTEQLDLGIRKLELDVFYDPERTLFPFAHPSGAASSSFPVLHVQNLDDRSSCVNLLACLAEIRAWSVAHPRHLPLFVSFNAKDDVIERLGFLRPLPFDEDAWLALDAELKAGLGERLLTPAEVFATGARDWPELDRSRGRMLAVLDEGGAKREAYAMRWRERAMFANLPEDHPGAAILIVNDPIADFERIQSLVRAGYIVRTRADADTLEARRGDTLRRERAFASGAQLVSTDYYRPAAHFGTDYVVALPGGVSARCNPLLTDGCRVEE
jgi:hypothetical protein